MQSEAGADVKSKLMDLLRRRPRKAAFVAELGSSLRRANTSLVQVEAALSELEDDRQIIVREESCTDPHLNDADLRIAALVESQSADQDAVVQAVEHIDAVWQQWLREYLASHSCT